MKKHRSVEREADALTEQETERALRNRQAVAMGAKRIPVPDTDDEVGEVEVRHPMAVYARSFGEDKMTTVEVAKRIGVSRELVRKWARDQRWPGVPKLKAPMGKSWMYLWDEEDVAFIEEQHRPRMVIDPEAREPERAES